MASTRGDPNNLKTITISPGNIDNTEVLTKIIMKPFDNKV